MFQRLESVDGSRTDWRIRVRLTRMWPSIGENGNVVGFNMIFLDVENYHVHVFANHDVWNALQNMFHEGNIYDIQNFVTREAKGRLRPVSSNYSILLTNHTIVHPVPLEVSTIPRHKFELVDLGDLYDLAISYTHNVTPLYAIDIIGFVQHLEPVNVANTVFGEIFFVKFQLCDGRNMIHVIVWDDNIASLAPLFEENFHTPPIVIMSTMRLSIFKSTLHVSSSPASRIFINIDYESVTRLRQRLLAEGHYAHVIDH